MTRPVARCRIVRGLLLASVLISGCQQEESREPLVIYAAASLTDVLREIAAAYTGETGRQVVFNFAGSNTLARQLEAAPRADLYLSAHQQWVDWLDNRGRLDSDSIRLLFSNQLVLIAHQDFQGEPSSAAGIADLPFALMAIAEPSSVPAGRYAKAWLKEVRLSQNQTLWDKVQPRLSPAPDVRAALAQVASRKDIIGMVYRTDFTSQPDNLRLLRTIPLPASAQAGWPAGPPIRYAAGILLNAGNPDPADAFLSFMTGRSGSRILTTYGFIAKPESR